MKWKTKKSTWVFVFKNMANFEVFHLNISSSIKLLFLKSVWNVFFQILWKSRCHILVTFPSHLKKLRSILRFWLEKLNCGFFHSFHSWKKTTKQLFSSKFQYRKYSVARTSQVGKWKLQITRDEKKSRVAKPRVIFFHHKWFAIFIFQRVRFKQHYCMIVL